MTFLNKIEEIDRLFSISDEKINEPSGMKNILDQFSFSPQEVKEYLVYPDDLPYGRKCAYRSPNFEVIVMNWKPFQSSNIHDHKNSFGCVYSVSGEATNVLYNENSDEIARIPLINNAIAEVPKGIFHSIENNSAEYSVSLHFYVPPLDGMTVIDRDDKSKRYTVETN